MPLSYTNYFRFEVLTKRSYLQEAWTADAINKPLKTEVQPDGRIRYWGRIPDDVPKLGGRALRVITEPDGTIHNAFPDRSFKP